MRGKGRRETEKGGRERGARQSEGGREGRPRPAAGCSSVGTSFIGLQRGGSRGQVREDDSETMKLRKDQACSHAGRGGEGRSMKAVLKPQQVLHGNTNQEAGCRAGRAAPSSVGRRRRRAASSPKKKYFNNPKSPTSVPLVLGSRPPRSAGTRSPASPSTDN